MKLELTKQLSIDKRALIRARLFDFMVGDWDRHAKQWGWVVQKFEDDYIAIPIAGDRDNAFFNPEGLIPTVLSNENVFPELRPFKEDIDFMEGLVYPFDRYFLVDTPEELFISEAEYLKKQLTDSVIQASMKVWPESIAKLSEKDIVNKIKHRRDDLITSVKDCNHRDTNILTFYTVTPVDLALKCSEYPALSNIGPFILRQILITNINLRQCNNNSKYNQPYKTILKPIEQKISTQATKKLRYVYHTINNLTLE